MDFINMLGLVWPENNFWAGLIRLFDVGSYVWTILIFTIILKLVLSPLDFFQRFYTNKNMGVQALIQPEMEKLRRQYGQNQMLLNKKQTELYSKYNFSMKGSCIVMLLYMVVTLVVFITLFQSLQAISSFKIKNQFEQLQSTYHTSYDANFDAYLLTINANGEEYNAKETDEAKFDYLVEQYIATNGGLEEDVKPIVQASINEYVSIAQDKVVEKYQDINDSWLWVKNIWRSDNPTVTAILSYNDFKSATGLNVTKAEYQTVMSKLLDNKQINTANGYFILSVIVVLVSFLSQYLTRKLSQPKGQSQQNTGLTKILMFVLPIAMLIFTITSSAMFSVYIITNSLVSSLLIPITTKLANKIEDKNEIERKNKNKASYSR